MDKDSEQSSNSHQKGTPSTRHPKDVEKTDKNDQIRQVKRTLENTKQINRPPENTKQVNRPLENTKQVTRPVENSLKTATREPNMGYTEILSIHINDTQMIISTKLCKISFASHTMNIMSNE